MEETALFQRRFNTLLADAEAARARFDEAANQIAALLDAEERRRAAAPRKEEHDHTGRPMQRPSLRDAAQALTAYFTAATRHGNSVIDLVDCGKLVDDLNRALNPPDQEPSRQKEES